MLAKVTSCAVVGLEVVRQPLEDTLHSEQLPALRYPGFDRVSSVPDRIGHDCTDAEAKSAERIYPIFGPT